MTRIMRARRGVRRNVELLWLRVGLLLFVIIWTVQYIKLQNCSTEDQNTRSQCGPTSTEIVSSAEDVSKEPIINSWPSRRWNYRPGNRSKFLTIGIPSVQRHNTHRVYLYDTLASIINNTRDGDKYRTRVLVFLTDVNSTYNTVTERTLRRRYPEYISNDFISIVSVHQDIYPNMTSIRRTFNDSTERLRWRAKQNIDFAYMFWYSRHISEYYLQLEDDVITASDYIRDIEKFIHIQTKHWFLLEFSKLGFIGKLFKSTDLELVAHFMYQNYDAQPCDLLLGAMRKEKGQYDPTHSNRSLFQHIGKFSSLKNKIMPSIDKTFKDIDNVSLAAMNDFPKGDNPPARIISNIIAYESYRPEYAYDADIRNHFWGKSQKKGDYVKFIFEKPQNFSRMILATGERTLRHDILQFGELRYSQTEPVNDECGRFEHLVDCVDGQVDTLAQGTVIPTGITCLEINVKKTWKTWLIIWRIELLTKH